MKRKAVSVILALVLVLSLAGCARIKELTSPKSDTNSLFEFVGGNYADFAKNYDTEPPVELRCRFDGEARVEYTVDDAETMKRLFDALCEITASGEQTDVYADDNTIVYTYVLDDGSELPLEFNSENLVLSGKREGIYKLENTKTFQMVSFNLRNDAMESFDVPTSEPQQETTATPDDEYAALVQSAIDEREDYALAVDDGNSLFEETQVKNILIFADGTGGLELTGELAKTYGDKVRICDNALAGNVFAYGNGGWRVIVFLMEDGTLSVINPVRLYSNHELQVIEKFAGLTHIVAIDEVSDDFATTVVATDMDGNTYLLDDYLGELS